MGSSAPGGSAVTTPPAAPITTSSAGDLPPSLTEEGDTESAAVGDDNAEAPPTGDVWLKKPWDPNLISAPTTPPLPQSPYDLDAWLEERGLSGLPRSGPCWDRMVIPGLPTKDIFICRCSPASFADREVLSCSYNDESARGQSPMVMRDAFYLLHQGRLIVALDLPLMSMLDVDCPEGTREYCTMMIDYEIVDGGLVASDEHNRCGRALPTLRARVAAGQARRQQLERAELICNAVGRYRWKGAQLVRDAQVPKPTSARPALPGGAPGNRVVDWNVVTSGLLGLRSP